MKTTSEIIKILNSNYYETESKLKVVYNEDLPNGKAGLNRDIFIEAENGEKFTIEWWINISYIKYEKAIIPCDKIEVANTFPNHSRLNIQAYFKNNLVFILPIRDYKE